MKDNKLTEFFKKITTSEAALKRVPIYFFAICVLLTVLVVKISKTNTYLQRIAENGTNSIEYQTRNANSSFDVFTETTKSIEDIIPMFEEDGTTESESQTQESTVDNSEKPSSNTVQSSSQAVTEAKTTVSDTKSTTVNNAAKTTYVINKSSKKIHKYDCSFVDRMNEENKQIVQLTDSELQEYLKNGYTKCSSCGG
ncbi:MAG: hypothetical protein ACI4KI_02385 [Candidatus Fimenecus sp.]